MIRLCRQAGIPVRELDFTLTQAGMPPSSLQEAQALLPPPLPPLHPTPGTARRGLGRRPPLLEGPCSAYQEASVLCLALQAYSADEAFVTGTFAGQIPVREIDGRQVGAGLRGPLVQRLQGLYAGLCDTQAAAGRLPVTD